MTIKNIWHSLLGRDQRDTDAIANGRKEVHTIKNVAQPQLIKIEKELGKARKSHDKALNKISRDLKDVAQVVAKAAGH